MEFVKDLCACATCGRLEMPCISVTFEVFELVVEYYRGSGLIHFMHEIVNSKRSCTVHCRWVIVPGITSSSS